ncbi:hypothetical protein FACS1894167_06030 [Synergistales bacterium]|nr:hypothetical protein FACS1894167_06030 [Synergistales bacterium]GHV53071.1 hypothetical protein FACS1894216_10370 [Synergistales bacterium]
MAEKKFLLGYLIVETKDNYFRGAALVVDQRGIPVDFRYTEPVRPTKLERILYGGALDIYLREEVILDNLLGAVETKPSIWLVDNEDLIDPVQKISKTMTLAIESTSHAPLDHSGTCEPSAEEGGFLFQADNISAPLHLIVSGDGAAKIQQTTDMLTAAAADMEIMEPFGRISRAFEAVLDA